MTAPSLVYCPAHHNRVGVNQNTEHHQDIGQNRSPSNWTSDADYYADPTGFDPYPGHLHQSARATLKAIVKQP